jgi:hypothetical protein
MISIRAIRERVTVPADKDGQLKDLLNEAIDLFEQATGRLWNRREDYVYETSLESIYDQSIWLPLYPIESIVVAEWDPYASPSAAYADIDVADYNVNKKVGRVDHARSSPWSNNRLQFTITGGYDETTVPPGVRRMILLQIEFMQQRLAPDKLAVEAVSISRAGTTSFLSPGLHPLVADFAEGVRRRA